MVEEDIINGLVFKFSYLKENIKLKRTRRIFANVEYRNFRELFNYAVMELGFSILCTITGLDEGEKFAAIYHVARQDGIILSIKTAVPKSDPELNTITDIFQCADIYERELKDLLGMKIKGLAEGKRYPLPDDWPEGEYPLRKDWKKAPNKDGQGDKNA